MRDWTVASVLRERMRSQRLSDATRVRGDAAAIARAVCGVQAQQLDAGMLSLRARGEGLTAAAAAHAHGAGASLVRTWLMRGTLHLVAADDARWLLGVYGPLNAARDATRRAQTGLTDALCDRAIGIMRRALADGPLTRHQLRERLDARGVAVPPGQAMIHLLALAASRGVLTLTEQAGRHSTFGLLDDVVPEQAPAPQGTRAEAELARRYFAAYAPASVADFGSWSGLPMTVVRRAVGGIGSELEELAAPLAGLLRLRSAPPVAADAPTVRLLPFFDTYLLGYRHRDVMISPERAARIYNGGWINPTVCVGGRLEGTWRLRPGRGETVVEVTPFEVVGRNVAPRLGKEVAAIGAFLGRPARLELRPATR